MKIFAFESLGSTSDQAAALLPTEALPFAVLARQQSQGRGRSGKSWASPEGGLYATLALDGKSLGATARGILPLAVACTVARWIEAQFGLRVTIKWPNDLLFAGAKLGGILCESSVHGSEWGPILIGVGLNLQAAPRVAEQASTSLAQILGLRPLLDSLELARSLVHYLKDELLESEPLALYTYYGIEAGQVWVDAQGAFARITRLSHEGQLQLENLQGTQSYDLSSVRHDWRWVYQKPRAEPLVLADIGNTLVKLLVSWPEEKEREPLLLRFAKNEAGELSVLDDKIELLRSLRLPRGWPVHAIAVNDQLREQFQAYIEKLGLRLVAVPKRPLRVRFDRYRWHELGIDRVALTEAARAAWPQRNLIVVSAGTAVTVEVLTADGVYQGGYIFAGLQTKLSALNARTARLPLIELARSETQELVKEELLGRDTRTAMVRGAVRETALALEGLRFALQRELGVADWMLVCTGGDGELLAALLGAPYHQRLILEGVAAMVCGG